MVKTHLALEQASPNCGPLRPFIRPPAALQEGAPLSLVVNERSTSGRRPRGRVGEDGVPEAAAEVPRGLLRSRSRHPIPFAECGRLAERRLWLGAGFQPAALTRPLAFSVRALGRPRRGFPPGASFSPQKGAAPGAAGGEPRRPAGEVGRAGPRPGAAALGPPDLLRVASLSSVF
nr:translation initiation factor IF-2-like [Saimiri boliviensis boliviensis]